MRLHYELRTTYLQIFNDVEYVVSMFLVLDYIICFSIYRFLIWNLAAFSFHVAVPGRRHDCCSKNVLACSCQRVRSPLVVSSCYHKKEINWNGQLRCIQIIMNSFELFTLFFFSQNQWLLNFSVSVIINYVVIIIIMLSKVLLEAPYAGHICHVTPVTFHCAHQAGPIIMVCDCQVRNFI